MTDLISWSGARNEMCPGDRVSNTTSGVSPMSNNNSNSSFSHAFLPGLILGLIIGAVAGAFLPDFLGGNKLPAQRVAGEGQVAGDRGERSTEDPYAEEVENAMNQIEDATDDAIDEIEDAVDDAMNQDEPVIDPADLPTTPPSDG